MCHCRCKAKQANTAAKAPFGTSPGGSRFVDNTAGVFASLALLMFLILTSGQRTIPTGLFKLASFCFA